MCEAIQKRGCHLCIAEDADPFAELQICCDDNAGLFIEFADQLEQQRAARFWERAISQFIDDNTIQRCQLPDDLSGVPLCLLFD